MNRLELNQKSHAENPMSFTIQDSQGLRPETIFKQTENSSIVPGHTS